MSVKFSDTYILSGGAAPGHFTLMNSFEVAWKPKGRPRVVFTVEAGFETDLASIPQVFQSVIPVLGRHRQPAIAHDWCYCGKTDLSKKDADLMFLDAMKSVGVGWWRRRSMYLAVRVGGKGHWS